VDSEASAGAGAADVDVDVDADVNVHINVELNRIPAIRDSGYALRCFSVTKSTR
jgi:hypothetical protein